MSFSSNKSFIATASSAVYTSYCTSPYRFGYQGSEQDNEVKGEGNSYTTFFRQLDPRLGRWLSIDPKASSMPWQSPYCSMDNNPIWFNDPLGDTTNYTVQKGDNMWQIAKNNGISLDKLKAYNPQISDPNKIQAGQILKIPEIPNPKLVTGTFVAVVNDLNTAKGNGHNALMIGNDTEGWTFISKEGRVDGDGNTISGGKALPARIEFFPTLKDLAKSKEFEEYDRVAVFKVNSNLEKPLIKKMTAEANSHYSLLTNNCGHACVKTLKLANITDGSGYKTKQIQGRYGGSTSFTYYSGTDPRPNVQYEAFKLYNSSKLVFKTTL